MVDELFVAAQVDRVGVFGADDEAEPIDPEVLAGAQIGDDQLGIRGADDVGWRGCGHRHDRRPERGLACHATTDHGGV